MTTKEMRFFVCDIETPREFFLFGGRFMDTGQIVKFRINRWHNDLYAMVKFIEQNPEIWYVGFNFLAFDSQVIEWVVREHENWHNKTNLEICAMIAERGEDCIDDQHYDIQPRIRVEKLSFRIIDLFKTHHFDNEQNRAGLKWLEIMMDIPNVAEMPIHHDRTDLTREEVQLIEDYWINDLDATEAFLRITLGETDLELYKGKNMLQERIDVSLRYKFPLRQVLNWSDTKMGEQINLLYFCRLKNIKPEDVYEMKKKRKPTRGFTFGKCIPEYVTFQTKQFQDFYEHMKNVRVSLHTKDEFPFSYNGTTYTIARGGIHSVDPKRIIDVPAGYKFVDIDLGSQYPGTLIRRLLYPKHLGPEWIQNVLERMTERINSKKGAKIKGIPESEKQELEGKAETLKKVLNAGTYGMTGQKDSWQYDPFVMYSCTIGNQFEMLMLVETFELAGIHCVSANTDGLTVLYPEDKEAEFKAICEDWERKIKLPVVEGEMQGRLEYTEYVRLVQEHVNCYIAAKKEGKIKVKGRFAYHVPLNKNNTKDITRIQRKAIQDYFDKGVPVEKTIRECDNIFMFIFGYKSRAFDFIATPKGGEPQNLGGLVRCYASTEGIKLTKSKEEDDNSKASRSKLIGDSYVTPYNIHITKPFHEYKINYDWYISKTLEITQAIDAAKFTGGVKKKKPPPPPPPEQTSLF